MNEYFDSHSLSIENSLFSPQNYICLTSKLYCLLQNLFVSRHTNVNVVASPRPLTFPSPRNKIFLRNKYFVHGGHPLHATRK